MSVDRVIDTRQGNVCIIVDNFKLKKKAVLKNHEVKFEYTKKNCHYDLYGFILLNLSY